MERQLWGKTITNLAQQAIEKQLAGGAGCEDYWSYGSICCDEGLDGETEVWCRKPDKSACSTCILKEEKRTFATRNLVVSQLPEGTHIVEIGIL